MAHNPTDPRGYLRRKPETHVCGIRETVPYGYRAWFTNGWEGPLRIYFLTAVGDLDAEQERRCRQLSDTHTTPRSPSAD